jgi:hypothetical protein
MGVARGDEEEEEVVVVVVADRGRRADVDVGDAHEAALLEGEVLEERLAKARSYLEPRS